MADRKEKGGATGASQPEAGGTVVQIHSGQGKEMAEPTSAAVSKTDGGAGTPESQDLGKSKPAKETRRKSAPRAARKPRKSESAQAAARSEVKSSGATPEEKSSAGTAGEVRSKGTEMFSWQVWAKHLGFKISPKPDKPAKGSATRKPRARASELFKPGPARKAWIVTGVVTVVLLIGIVAQYGWYSAHTSGLEARSKAFELEVAQLKQDLSQERKAVGDLPSATAALEKTGSEIAAAEAQLVSLRDEVASVSGEKSVGEKELLRIDAELAERRTEVGSIKEEAAQARAELERVLVQRREALEELATTRENQEALSARLDQLNTRVETLQSEQKDLEDLVIGVRKELSDAVQLLQGATSTSSQDQ